MTCQLSFVVIPGVKISAENEEYPHMKLTHLPKRSAWLESTRYGLKEEFVERINTHQAEWTAAVYPQFENMTVGELVQMAGGRKIVPSVKPRSVTLERIMFARLIFIIHVKN